MGTTTTSPAVRTVRKGKTSGQEFMPHALATQGDELFVHSWVRLYRRSGGGRFREVGEFGTIDRHQADLLCARSVLWACGLDGLVRSDDGGETFEPVPLRSDESMAALAEDADGGIWVGGGHHGCGALLHRGPGAGSFALVPGPADMVTCLANTSMGVVVGDRAGVLWLGARGAVEKLHETNRSVRTVFETEGGALLVVVGEPESFDELALLRSTDGGATFEEHDLDRLSIRTLAQLPEGPIVAGADWGVVGLSHDDGRSFETLCPEGSVASRPFTVSCVHDGAVIVGGRFNDLIEVRLGASAPPAKPVPRRRKRRKNRRGYVASGRFAHDLEAACGSLSRKPVTFADGVDEALNALAPALASELEVLHELLHSTKPSLCGLRLGAWVSLPAQYGLDAEGVLEAEWFGDPEDAALVASAVEIFNDQGSPFVIVGDEGVFVLDEDPHDYWQVADDLESFLRTLVAVEAAARGNGSVEEAEELLVEHIYVDEGDSHPGFFEHWMAKARKR